MNVNEGEKMAQRFAKQLQQQGFPILQAILFGSWIKGTATKDSDIDVCIVSDQFGKDYIQEMVDLRKVALLIDSRIEPIPFTPDDLIDPHSSLSEEIRTHSIDLPL